MRAVIASALLHSKYGFSETFARTLLAQASADGKALHGIPNGPGHVSVTCEGKGRYRVEKHSEISSAAIAQPGRMRYTSGNAKPPTITRRKAKTMPPRGKRAAQTAPAVEEPEEAEVEGNEFERHLTGDLSPTMQDFGDWYHENVADIDEMGKTDPGRLLAHGSTLYPRFQKSELNITRRAARKAERAAAAPAPAEEAEAAPAPARRGRGAATAPAATKAPATAKAGRGRGKPAAKVEAY
jgi:hypothetical protein